MYDKDVRIFLGGYPGAGKSALTEYLVKERGWIGLDMDGKGTNRVLELLDAPLGHPAFEQTPLVVEGGFLDKAPKFRNLIRTHSLTTFWLTGSRANLVDSRLKRNAYWDNRSEIVNGDWMGLVDRYRFVVPWDFEIQMWHTDGTRKTYEEVAYEIESCVLEGVHQAHPGINSTLD